LLLSGGEGYGTLFGQAIGGDDVEELSLAKLKPARE